MQIILPSALIDTRGWRAGRSMIEAVGYVGECLIILGMLGFIVTIRDGSVGHHYMYLGIVTVLLWHVLSFQPGGNPSCLNLVRDALARWGTTGIFLLTFGYITGSLEIFSGTVILYWFGGGLCTLVLWRIALQAAASRFVALNRAKTRAIVVGLNALGVRLSEKIRQNPGIGLSLLGFVDDRFSVRRPNSSEHILGTMADINTLVDRFRVERIYVTLPMSSQPRLLALLDKLRDTTASIYFVPDIFIADLIQARVDEVAGLPVVAVCETPFYGMRAVLKRLSDLVLAFFALAVGWPALLAIMVGVKLSSPGPVIFKQRRHGLDGREILIYKFRTMTVCEDGPMLVQASRNDVRVTPLGAFLRRHSLDELPQLFNVIQGRMSIVGPRPHALAHNDLYRKSVSGYMVRHKVKPGITGWAQINGLRGETDTIDKMKARIDCDLDYLRMWSLTLDLKIILRTVLVVFTGRNAY